MSHSVKPAHLTLTPHHLYYLLTQIEELGIAIGPMNVRLESIHNDPTPANYVSFLQSAKPSKGQSDRDSIHSVSSVRSVMSGVSAFWSTIGLGSSNNKSEKAKVALEADLKYLYSAFTKLPSLRFAPDHRARLIKGHEEFPFDTAVPLFAFKNVQQLEIIDIDFRQFHGWDRLADQLSLLTVKRAKVDDPVDVIINIVLDDIEKRRRRSTKGGQSSPTLSWTVPSTPRSDNNRASSDPGSPAQGSPSKDAERYDLPPRADTEVASSVSPKRPTASRPASSYRHVRTYSSKVRRSESGSSNSTDLFMLPYRSESLSNFPAINLLPSSKWQRLKYLSLADNGMTNLSARGLLPLAGSLRSLNLSSNLFAEIPDSLSCLIRLTSLDLSGCMIESLQSLSHSPLPAIVTLKLRSNRLKTLAGIERLVSLENLNVQDNRLTDAIETARLTGMPNFSRVFLKRNPFVRSTSDYRVKVFNLFRQTPGYLEDISIDDLAPTYTERKLLVDRVPDTEHTNNRRTVSVKLPLEIVDPPKASEPSAESVNSATRDQGMGSERPPLPSVQSRRRSGRRRIVDLAGEENASRGQSFEISARITSPTATQAAARRPISTPVDLTQSDLAKLRLVSGIAPGHDSSGAEPREVDYRVQIEKLRREFGSNWITALRDQTWPSHLQALPSLADPHPPFHLTNSHAIASGGEHI